MISAFVLLSLASGPSAVNLEAYTKFQEFHFELRMTDSQRSKYKSLLTEDYGANRLRSDIDGATATVESWCKGDLLSILGTHSSMKQADDIELATEQMLNNGTIHGSGIYAQTRKEAKSGCKSSQFLLKAIADYRKPVRGDGNVYASLFQSYLDGTYEWTSVKFVLTLGKKVWDGSPENRRQVQSEIVKVWDGLGSEQKRSSLLGWLQWNQKEWLAWRLADYKHFQRMTRYQQKEQLADWARGLAQFAPDLASDLAAREKDFKDYLKAMPATEVKAEFERMSKFNTRFTQFIQQKHGEQQALKQTVTMMQNSLLDFHVANLNISENMGNTGFRWRITP